MTNPSQELKKMKACPACDGNGWYAETEYDSEGQACGETQIGCSDCQGTGKSTRPNPSPATPAEDWQHQLYGGLTNVLNDLARKPLPDHIGPASYAALVEAAKHYKPWESTRPATPDEQTMGKVREALEKYGEHFDSCPVKTFNKLGRNYCTCGFDDALSEALLEPKPSGTV